MREQEFEPQIDGDEIHRKGAKPVSMRITIWTLALEGKTERATHSCNICRTIILAGAKAVSAAFVSPGPVPQ
jgi:hypothetical protein